MVIIPLIVKYQDRKIQKFKIWLLIKQEFGKKITRLTTIYFFIFVLYPALYFTILTIYLKTALNFEDTFIGLLYAFWLVAVIPGSIVGGILADKYGRKLPLYIFLIFIIIFSVTPIIIKDYYIIILNFTILMFFINGAIAATWAMIMDVINPKISAAEHEIICSIVNLGSIIIGSVTGTLIVMFGFNNLFLLSALIIIIALAVLYRIKNIDKINWKI